MTSRWYVFVILLLTACDSGGRRIFTLLAPPEGSRNPSWSEDLEINASVSLFNGREVGLCIHGVNQGGDPINLDTQNSIIHYPSGTSLRFSDMEQTDFQMKRYNRIEANAEFIFSYGTRAFRSKEKADSVVVTLYSAAYPQAAVFTLVRELPASRKAEGNR